MDKVDISKSYIGIELGSTRIKSVMIDEKFNVIASGESVWENRFENGIWTYGIDEALSKVQESYGALRQSVMDKYGENITTVKAIGISAMMHGYIALDSKDNVLVPFRTWRNTITAKSADELSDLFDYPIPQRWTISHIDHAMVSGEPHVNNIASVTTLAGYIHYILSGNNVLGIGEASGVFPIKDGNYNSEFVKKYNARARKRIANYDLNKILPKVLLAGENGGTLTKEGAALLDASGNLRDGINMCPPEGDAGTGMVATNSVTPKTGNVSAGTSVFAMIVLSKRLDKPSRRLDMVTTPDGSDVAMVHCNNCTSDINAWMDLLHEAMTEMGVNVDKGELFTRMFNKALSADIDCGKLMNFNYLSGEHITGFNEGRPMFMRRPDSNFNLSNFMRALIQSSLASLKIGADILIAEGVEIEKIYGHGGLFKTKDVGQRIMSAVFNSPVTLMDTAGEGGAYGMAVLAAYTYHRDKTLTEFLKDLVFSGAKEYTLIATEFDHKCMAEFTENFKKSLPAEHSAVEFF